MYEKGVCVFVSLYVTDNLIEYLCMGIYLFFCKNNNKIQIFIVFLSFSYTDTEDVNISIIRGADKALRYPFIFVLKKH